MSWKKYASLKGYGAMKRMGYGKPALKASRRQLAKAFGTYALAAGVPAVAVPLAIRAAKKWKKRKLEEAAKQ
jgi:hypothetical protein